MEAVIWLEDVLQDMQVVIYAMLLEILFPSVHQFLARDVLAYNNRLIHHSLGL